MKYAQSQPISRRAEVALIIGPWCQGLDALTWQRQSHDWRDKKFRANREIGVPRIGLSPRCRGRI
jgi:hypothetical protein